MKARTRLFSRKSKDTSQPQTEPRLSSSSSSAQRQKVSDSMVVSLEYTLTDDQGKVLDSTQGSGEFSYIHGSNMLLPGIQKALKGKHQGDMISLRLLPKEAFGMHDPDAMQEIEQPLFGDTEAFEEGMQFEMQTSSGKRLVTVKHIDETVITVDLNHPLAGKTINVSATVLGVRPASEIELKNQEIF